MLFICVLHIYFVYWRNYNRVEQFTSGCLLSRNSNTKITWSINSTHFNGNCYWNFNDLCTGIHFSRESSKAIKLDSRFLILIRFFQDDWRLVSGISAAFCVGTLILTYFLPESPSWLISRGRMTEAKESLAFIRAVKKDGKNEINIF